MSHVTTTTKVQRRKPLRHYFAHTYYTAIGGGGPHPFPEPRSRHDRRKLYSCTPNAKHPIFIIFTLYFNITQYYAK